MTSGISSDFNRFGPHPDGLVIPGRANDGIGEDGVSCASAIDAHWRLLLWDLFGDGIKQLDPRYMPLLEFLVERIPPNLRNEDNYRVIGEGLFRRAQQRMKFDDEYHRCMWNAVRFAPTTEVLEAYIDVLKRKGFQQTRYFERLRPDYAPAAMIGTAIASSDGFGSPDRAFDGRSDTFWISAERGPEVKYHAWIGYALTAPQSVRRIQVKQTSNMPYRQDLVRVKRVPTVGKAGIRPCHSWSGCLEK